MTTGDKVTRGQRGLLMVIVTLGLALRLVLWWRVPIHAPANDEHEYLQVAHDLVAGRGWVFYDSYHWLRAPLYPLFLAGSLWLFGGDLRWAALPNILVSTATIPLFFHLGRVMVTPRPRTEAGLIAATMSALLLPFATFASLWMSETLWTALFASACLLLTRWAERPRLATAALAGLMLGLATLTRSAPLAAFPLLAGWMLWQRPPTRPLRAYLVGTAVCLSMAGATIVPWTARNWIAYGYFIPVETGLSYNLWAFNEPREDTDTIFRTLESIENPGERAAYASAKGMERLREDPAILLRKLWPNWAYLWRIKPIQDRFRQQSFYEDVPGPLFMLGLVLDDGLYVLIAVCAAAGVVLLPRSAPKTLLGGWAVYAIAITLVTHGEARYRQLLYPTLIPLGAAVLAGGWWRASRPVWRLVALGLVLIALLPLRSYPYRWAVTNVRRAWAVASGDRAMARQDYLAAQQAYERAITLDQESADALLRLGLAYDRAGQLTEAIQAYRWAAALRPPYVATSARLGDALRRAGMEEAARAAFAGSYADPRAISDWAWEHLETPPPRRVEVGDGLDIGYVGGMYAAEAVDGRRARWTMCRAGVRLASHAGGSTIHVRLAAPRPNGQPVVARLCVAGRCQTITADEHWRTYRILSGAELTGTLTLEFHTPTFTPAARNAGESDTRRLGLLVDDVTIESR